MKYPIIYGIIRSIIIEIIIMSELFPANTDKKIDRRTFLRSAAGLFGLAVLTACGGGPDGTSPTPAPAVTSVPESQGYAWDVDCTAQVQVEAGDVFGDVIDRAQDTCPNLSIHDGYESFYMQDRSVNNIMAGETVTLNDYKNVP
ncbi:hypothetical protein IPM65_03585 [Candidatus Roizmanbacteria bacterium]|nr:MAG: hypothetical protein IPM65_03585 [Candidatus Roizmanbacteria bacterium]